MKTPSRPETPQSKLPLGAENIKSDRGPQLPMVCHQSRVEYNEGRYALRIGHVVPVWSVRHWCTLPETVQAVSNQTLRVGDELVTRTGKWTEIPVLLESLKSDYEAQQARAAGQVPPRASHAEIFLREGMKSTILGNCAGQRIVRPGTTPYGCMPMESVRTYEGKDTFEYSSLSPWEWAEEVAMEMSDGNIVLPPAINEPPPEIGFFVADKDGVPYWDATTQRVIAVRRIPLPFSWQSAEELNLLARGEDYEVVADAGRLALSMSATVRRMALSEGWEGSIFMGLVIPAAEFSLIPSRLLIGNEPEEGLEMWHDVYEGNLFWFPYVKGEALSPLSRSGLEQTLWLRDNFNTSLKPRSVQRQLRSSAGRYAELPDRH